MPANAFAPPTSKSIASYVKRNAPKVKQSLRMQMRGMGAQSLRETDYNGHHIAIQTIYRIAIDGRPFAADLAVMNNGQVHYHAIPNMTFDSAIDLVKALIDVFPQDFTKEALAQARQGQSMNRSGMRGMRMGRRKLGGKKSKSRKTK